MPESMSLYSQDENSSRLWQPIQQLCQKRRGRSKLDYFKEMEGQDSYMYKLHDLQPMMPAQALVSEHQISVCKNLLALQVRHYNSYLT